MEHTQSDLRDVILMRLAKIMREVPEADARQLAALLTGRINSVLAGMPPVDIVPLPASCTDRRSAIEAAMPDHMHNAITLEIPWSAFARAYPKGEEASVFGQDTCTLLCSLPEVYSRPMRAKLVASNIWPGSLLDQICGLIAGARKELIIVNPYWSRAGVDAVLRRIAAGLLTGCSIEILTLPAPHQKQEALKALYGFRDGLIDAGATCALFSPPVTAGWTPLMHAKIVMADNRLAYIGSANFSGNGWDASVEVGVCLKGPKAAQLGLWLSALRTEMDCWA